MNVIPRSTKIPRPGLPSRYLTELRAHLGKKAQGNGDRAQGMGRAALVGMRERVEMVGGLLAVESTPGTGTTVRVEIPFNPEKKNK